MDSAKQHWKILQKLGTDLVNKVREFMVIGYDEDGVIVVTEDGLGFWLGTMRFGRNDSRTTKEPTPLNVPDLVSMAQNENHLLLLNKRGQIYSMGKNDRGQLGLGTVNREVYFSPQLIPSPHKFISVRCGDEHSVALTEDGKCWAWGSNCLYQVGVFGPSNSTPFVPTLRQIPELDPHRVVTIECGANHCLALTDQGVVYGWGNNANGQLGDDSEGDDFYQICQDTPIRISTPSPVRSMAAGFSHTLLLTRTGEVYACGKNDWGQLGLPTTTKCSPSLVKVEGLPQILQIASHPAANLSIAMSSDKRCFVWGELLNEKGENSIPLSTPLNLHPVFSTVESPLSFYSLVRGTPFSVQVPENPPYRLSTRMYRMFDNPAASPDVQFVVEQRTIHAHRIILSNSSDYFARMFSERSMAGVDPEDPIIKVTIPDHSYETFRIFLRLFYTDNLEVNSKLLVKLFELSIQYIVPDLQRLCLSRMRETLTPTTFCLYYQLTHRHLQHPELASFQQELVQFASIRLEEVVETNSYHKMKPKLCNILTNAVQNIL